MRYYFLLFFFVLCSYTSYGQRKDSAVVYDASTKKPIPFATIKFGDGQTGTIAGLNGNFGLDKNELGGAGSIEVSCIGYEAKRLLLPLTQIDIYLKPKDNALAEVVIKPQNDKIYRILNAAIANKGLNNPEKYDWYRCKVYYKMVLDARLPDFEWGDTGKQLREINEFKDFIDKQHLLMTETYSTRTWKKPQHLQEDVIGSRLSGFKKSMFTGLVTDVLPFHAYNDYISLNGKDYHNPLSKGYKQHYKFNLSDELLQGTDTLWIISFTPKEPNGNELKGKICISSHGYAIANIVANATDTVLKRDIQIEHEYKLVSDRGIERWFPAQLNYIISLKFQGKHHEIDYHIKGNSLIDSVVFTEDKAFHFDKTHTVKLQNNADELPDSIWKRMRPMVLDKKDERTSVVLDSLGDKMHFDNRASYFSKLPEGKVPISIFDLDLKRLLSANYYELYRFGLGLQTNERVIKWLSVGGWAGYGVNDVHWKYGAFSEFYLDKSKEFVIKAGYEHDLGDPGRVSLSKELDKTYLKTYLLRRVDEVDEYKLSIKKKFGYLSMELAGVQQAITPKYAYALDVNGKDYSTFTAKEVSFNLRYAYAERTAPVFGHYLSVGSKYPVLYGKVIYGNVQSADLLVPYTKAIAAIGWQKHINRLGNERFLVEGAKLWSNTSVPLSELFAGNGFKNSQQSIYTFNGMMTMLPYEYYTDQFVNVMLRHEFDWKLYKLRLYESSITSVPFIGLQYNVLYGTLQHPEAHKYVTFGVPDNAYNEAGVILNSIVRLRYLNVQYITFNMGYFYHITPVFDANKNGRLVYSLGVEF